MKLNERLNVLIQAITLAQKGGILTLDEAFNAKTAIDVISSGILNQNFISAINVLIEITSSSQKKGVYSLKDAYTIYLAIDDIENEFRNEVIKLSGRTEVINKSESQNMITDSSENNQSKKLKKNT